MKLHNIVVSIIVISAGVLLILNFRQYPKHHTNSGKEERYDIGHLLKVLHAQNDTISSLVQLIEEKHPTMTNLLESIKSKDAEIEHLHLKLSTNNQLPTNDQIDKSNFGTGIKERKELSEKDEYSKLQAHVDPFKMPINILQLEPEPMEESCEKRYGLSLIDSWRRNEQKWCSTKSTSSLESTLKCYPYHQQHKKLDGRGADLFCTAENFFIDFSKVRCDVFHFITNSNAGRIEYFCTS